MKGQQPQLPPIFEGTMLVVIIVAGIVGLIIGLTILVFYCLTMQKALSRCSERNQLMSPGMVWLLFIPCFGFIWSFFVAIQVPGSLQKEFRDRDRDDGSDYGRTIGLTQCILNAVAIPISVIPFVGICGSIMSLVAFVLFIVFWVKIAGYSSQLASGGGRRIRDREFDDDDDV
jgi:hypothetical protein